MSYLLKSVSPETSKLKRSLQFDKGSRNKIKRTSSSNDKDPNKNFGITHQLDCLGSQSMLQSNQKKINSEKKIIHVFSQPKSTIHVSLKNQTRQYKDLINISDKKLTQSLKRIALGSQTQKQNKKVKSFQMPFTFISQSVDLLKPHSNQKSFTSPKMPDLLKIKLKKQLQSIQKNNKPKKPHFMRNHHKSHLKRQSSPVVFPLCQFDKFEEQKRYERAIEKAKRNIINERKFNNFKKTQKWQRKEKASITISHFKDTIDFKLWQKRTNTEETIDQKYLGNQRNQAKYSRLLEYVKKPTSNSFLQSPQKRKSRIKTESALYSSIIAPDFDILQLEGTKIFDQSLKGSGLADVSMMVTRSKLRNGRTTPVQTKPKMNMFHKLRNSESGTKQIKEESHLFYKNHEISPWADSTQQCENELD